MLVCLRLMRDSFARFFWKADERDALRRDPALLEADESDELRRDPALLEAEERELRRDRALLEAEERDELRRAMLEADHHDALDPQPDEPPRDEQWRASDQTALDQPSENLYRELSSFNTENSQDRQSNHDYDIPNNTKYHHPNLRTTDKHIRLLELLPLTPDGMINCKFHYYKLGECPSFTAISYTWGEALPTHTINVNMFDVVVRENLWQFLRQMDAQQVRRLFWIDALCINQGSTEEKNHQVALMWEIYAQASEVFIWLGIASANSNLAIGTIRTPPLLHHNNYNHDLVFPNFPKDEMKAILELFERRYWARIWTAQEILFAKSIFVLCGGSSIKWEHFHWIYSHLDGWRLDHDAVFNKAELRRLWRSSAIRSIARKANWTIRGRSEDWSLRSLISKYKHMESTDPRDMVYALLSLCKDPRTDDSTRTAIVADYSKSTVEVYADALNHIRRSEEDPDSHHFQLCITQLQTALRLDLNDPAVQRETLLCFPKLNYFRFRRFSYTLAGRTRSVGPVSWSLETLKLAQSPRYRLSTETEPSVPFSMTDPLHSLAKAKQHPNETWAMRIFAKKLEDDDQLEEAVELRKRLFEKRRRENFSDPETLGEMIDLAFRLRQLGQDEEATKMCEDILGSIKGDLRRGE